MQRIFRLALLNLDRRLDRFSCQKGKLIPNAHSLRSSFGLRITQPNQNSKFSWGRTEPTRSPTFVGSFKNQAKPNNRLRYLSWAKTISSPLAIVLAMCQGPLRLLPCRIAYFCGTFIASKFRRRGHDPRSFPSSDRISPISDSETRPIFSLILPRSIDRS